MNYALAWKAILSVAAITRDEVSGSEIHSTSAWRAVPNKYKLLLLSAKQQISSVTLS